MTMASRGRVDPEELERYRALDCRVILPKLAEYVKADLSFEPIHSGDTHRWHVRADGRDYEILTTGAKWFDTRAKRGGGGAIDLAMHLYRVDFKQAIQRLREAL